MNISPIYTRSLLFALFIVVCTCQSIPRACSTPETSNFPFCNTSLSIDERVWDLISRIEDNEKPPLLTARMSPGGNISRLGLPEYDWGANCIHGVQSRCGTKCPTSFSNPIGLSASFNMSIVKQMGAIIGLELRSLWLQGVGENHPNNLPHLGLDCWSPNINIARDPRWGRIMETSGEDPYLSGQFGTAYTIGLQNGTLDARYLQAVVTLKHWDAYSLEDSDGFTRYNFNALVSLYDFSNTYFPAFKASVTQGNAKGVMCSYNAINGVPTCASQFLNNTLRGTWGFDGYVTSDSDSVSCIVADHHYTATAAEASAVAILAGTDIDSGNTYLDNLIPAVQQKLINMSSIDLALYHTLKLRFELGLFDPIEDQPYWHVSPDVVNTAESQAFNLFATQSTFVLLKNDGPILPIPRGKNIAVIGPHGNATTALVGNYLGQICPGGQNDFSCVVSPFLAIQQANTGGTTTYAMGCAINSADTSGFEEAITNAKLADHVLLFVGIDTTIEGEAKDRANTTLPGVQPDLAQEILSLGKPVAIVLLNGGPVSIDSLAVTAPSILEVFYPGFQGGYAIASAIFGDYNPGGKMPYTVYPTNYLNQVNMSNMDMSLAPGRTYKYYTGTPIWPFGYGLSYTQFDLAWNGSAPQYTISNRDDTSVTYSVKVTNIGKVAGDEVIQVYMKPPNDTLIIKQLIAFERVHVLPGSSEIVSFEINRNDLLVGDQNGDLVCRAGEYALTFTNGVKLVLDTVLAVKGTTTIIMDKLYA
jgi:beta-D-xylosidase 4